MTQKNAYDRLEIISKAVTSLYGDIAHLSAAAQTDSTKDEQLAYLVRMIGIIAREYDRETNKMGRSRHYAGIAAAMSRNLKTIVNEIDVWNRTGLKPDVLGYRHLAEEINRE